MIRSGMAMGVVAVAILTLACGGEDETRGAPTGTRPGPAEGHFYVETGGSDQGDGSPTSPWRSIDSALALVPASATLHLGPGVYHGSLSVSAAVALVGAGQDSTFIVSSGHEPVLAAAADLSLADLSVSGLEDWGGGYARHAVGSLVELDHAHLDARRVGLYNFTNYGVTVRDGSFELRDVSAGVDPRTPGGARSYRLAADIGLRLIRSSGLVEGYSSGPPPDSSGGHWVDHQIRLEPGPGDTVRVLNASLHAYGLRPGEGWADGIQIYATAGPPPSVVQIEGCTIVGPPPGFEASSAVEVMGGDVNVVLRGNELRRFAAAFRFTSQTGIASAVVEGNVFAGNAVDVVR